MGKRIRIILLLAAAAIFFTAGPFLVLYSYGLRFDWETFSIVKTGGIGIDTEEKDFSIKLNGYEVKSANSLFSGYLIDNLIPKTYQIEVKKDGYLPWRQELKVLPAQVAITPKIVFVPELSSATVIKRSVNRFAVSGRQLAWNETGADFFLMSVDDLEMAINLTQLFNHLKKTELDLPGFVPIEDVSLDGSPRIKIKTARAAYWLDTDKFSLEFIGSNAFGKPTNFLSPDSRLLASPLDESVTLVADKEAFRFNMPLGKHITEVSWYGDSEHLFIRSGNELYFLDAALGLPINLTKIAENVEQYSYDARTKRLYLLMGNILEYLIF